MSKPYIEIPPKIKQNTLSCLCERIISFGNFVLNYRLKKVKQRIDAIEGKKNVLSPVSNVRLGFLL